MVDRRRNLVLGALLAPFLLATVLGLVVLWPDEVRAELPDELGAPEDLFDARVVDVERRACAGTQDTASVECATPTVRLLEGPDEGEERTLLEQPVGPGLLDVEDGDTVVLSYVPDVEEEFRYAIADRARRGPLVVLAVAFAAAVVVLGRWRGVRALVAMGVSLGVVVLFVLPALLEGSSPLAVSLTGAAIIGLLAIYLTHGVSPASTTALLGTLASLALVGGLATVFVELADFTGLASEESTFLTITAGQVDLRGLLLGGIVIGTLGVLDDVTVTQVSAVEELRRANPEYGRLDLYRSAVRVGRDHIASAVNTLVLAYVGASLPLLLVFTQAGQDLGDVLNGEAVAVEVVRTLTGSIGLVASVPLTTALAATVVSWGRRPGPDPGTEGDPRRHLSRRERQFWSTPDPDGGDGRTPADPPDRPLRRLRPRSRRWRTPE